MSLMNKIGTSSFGGTLLCQGSKSTVEELYTESSLVSVVTLRFRSHLENGKRMPTVILRSPFYQNNPKTIFELHTSYIVQSVAAQFCNQLLDTIMLCSEVLNVGNGAIC